jgi:hypothetical protein
MLLYWPWDRLMPDGLIGWPDLKDDLFTIDAAARFMARGKILCQCCLVG